MDENVPSIMPTDVDEINKINNMLSLMPNKDAMSEFYSFAEDMCLFCDRNENEPFNGCCMSSGVYAVLVEFAKRCYYAGKIR